jgi:hypothetical protein
MRLSRTLILIALLMVTGCKTRQFTSIKADKSEWESVEMEWNAPQPFNWNALDIRMDVEVIQRTGSNNLKARLRFMKDSLGFVQIKPSVGIVDVARLVFTPDSSFLVDLINNRAFGGATSELPLDLPQLQSLLIGVPVLLDSINSYKAWKNQNGQFAFASQEALAMLSQPMQLMPGQVILMNNKQETTGQIAGFPEQNIRVDWQALELSEDSNPGKYPVKGMIRLRNSGETTEIRYQITKLEIDRFSSLSYSIPPRLTLEPFSQVGK